MINYREKLICYTLANDVTEINHLLEFLGISRNHFFELIKEIKLTYSDGLQVNVNSNYLSVNIINSSEVFNCLKLTQSRQFNSVDYRIAYLIYRLLFSKDYLAIDDLAEEMIVSRSTLNNDLRKAKKVLVRYNSQILGVPNRGIIFKGSEFNKRLIIIYELYEKLGMSLIPTQKTSESINDVYLYYNLNDFRKNLFYKAFMVTLYRHSQGYYLDQKIPLYKNFESKSLALETLIDNANILLGSSIKESEIDFFCFPINTRNSSFISDLENKYNVEVLKSLVSEMMKKVKNEFMIEIDEDMFFTKVNAHLLFLINRLIFKLPNTEVFSEDLRLRYPLAFELAKISLDVLSQRFDFIVEDIDINYFSIYFAVVLNERNMVTNGGQVSINNVAIISNRGKGFYEYISNHLKDYIGSDTKMEHINTMYLESTDLTKYNLVFTTENLTLNEDVPMVKIKQLFPSQESITEKINEVIAKNNVKVREFKKHLSTEFRKLDTTIGYEKNVHVIINDLIKEKKVSKSLLDNFKRREQESTMLYENGVAFPHLVDDEADKMVLVLANAGNYENDLNSLFLLVLKPNITKEEEQILTTLYNFVFSIIGNKELILKVKEISDIDSLTEIVEEVSIYG